MQIGDLRRGRSSRGDVRQSRRRALGHPPGPYTSREMAARHQGTRRRPRTASPSTSPACRWAALIAQEYALAYPGDLRSVVLANTYAKNLMPTRARPSTSGVGSRMTAGMPVMMRQQAPWVFSPAFYAASPTRSPGSWWRCRRASGPGPGIVRGAGRRVAHAGRHQPGRLDPRSQSLVLVADDDIIIRPALSRRLFKALPHGTWATVPGGHAAFWEDPGPWNRAVIDFIGARGAGLARREEGRGRSETMSFEQQIRHHQSP